MPKTEQLKEYNILGGIHMNKFRLEQRLRELNEIIKSGKATQAIIEEQFKIQLLLDNVYYID